MKSFLANEHGCGLITFTAKHWIPYRKTKNCHRISPSLNAMSSTRFEAVWSLGQTVEKDLADCAKIRYFNTFQCRYGVGKHAWLPFDALLTTKLAHDYKPSPAVYQLSVDYLGYKPDEPLMVACHKYDLNAAKSLGMRTAFVARPLEFGPNYKQDLTPEAWFDLYVDSLITLIEALGA